MLIHVKVLNQPSIAETSFEVKEFLSFRLFQQKSLQVLPSDTIQQVKTLIFDRLKIPIQQQKLILRGKALHEGSLGDLSIGDGAKLHLMVSGTLNVVPPSSTSMNPVFVEQLKLLASKLTNDGQKRDAFVTAFQTVTKLVKIHENKSSSRFTFR